MKLKLLLAATLLTTLTGCSEPAATASDDALDLTKRSPEIWVDPDTQCQYLIVNTQDGGSITARMSPNGKPMCSPLD